MEKKVYITKEEQEKCRRVAEAFAELYGLENILVMDAGRYGFVKLQYYKEPQGFDDVITFTDSQSMFENLWQEWLDTKLYLKSPTQTNNFKEEHTMEMNINEKKALYAFGCPVLKATVERLRMLAAITPDPGTKKLFYKLAIKLLDEGVEDWYRCFFYNLRIEMENYFNAQLIMSLAEVSTIEVEGYDYEADEV